MLPTSAAKFIIHKARILSEKLRYLQMLDVMLFIYLVQLIDIGDESADVAKTILPKAPL